jgi:hypothetical protein
LLPLTILCAQLFSQDSQLTKDKSSDDVTLRIIVVSSAEQAQHILDELKGGEDFATIAKRASIDSTAGDGGYLGKVALSALRPELRDSVAGLSPGQLSPVVRTPLGFAILKVESEKGPEGSSASDRGGTAATASIGSVKYAFILGGFGEAELGLNNFDKPTGWNKDPRTICEVRKQSLAQEKQSLEDVLAPANRKIRASLAPIDVLNLYYSLGEIYSYEGDMEDAVSKYNQAYQIAASQAPKAQLQMDEAMGVAYLHKSEMENGLYRTPGDRCLRPMLRSSAYRETDDSAKAVEYFL